MAKRYVSLDKFLKGGGEGIRHGGGRVPVGFTDFKSAGRHYGNVYEVRLLTPPTLERQGENGDMLLMARRSEGLRLQFGLEFMGGG